MKLWSSFQNIFILRRSIAASFADIIKIAAIFIKTTYKDLKSSKNKKLYNKMQSISVFLDITKIADF